MRTQHPHAAAASLRDVPDDLPDCDGAGACSTGAGFPFPGHGLCCPDDPLDLVLHLFPPATAAAAPAPPPPPHTAADPPPPSRPEQEREHDRPQEPRPLTEADCGSGAWELDSSSWGGLSCSDVLDGLGLGLLDEIDVDMFLADGDGGGAEATQANLLRDPSEPKPPAKAAAHVTAGGGPAPVPVHTRGGSLGFGGGAVPNDASPPVPAGGALHRPYDAFDGVVFNNAFAAPTMPAGGGPPPRQPLLALMPAAAAPAATPAVPGLHACGALPGVGIVSHSGAPAPVPPPPPPPTMAPLPARALPLHTSTALLAGGVYSSSSNAPPSATPSPPSCASSGGSGRGCPPSSSTESETNQFPAAAAASQPHACVVPRKARSSPLVNRRRIKRPWLLKFPLHALPPVVVARPPPPPPPPFTTNPVAAASSSDEHYINDDDDDGAKKNWSTALVPFAPAPPPLPGKNTTGDDDDDDAATATAGGGGGGGGGFRKRRRLMAPRQRNRKAERVCSHCGSPETPQWRAGPDGPGTLCNACGIRYAANRLLPEYRPSTAPSFRSGEHSNRHRKVMKLREQMTTGMAEEEVKPSAVVKKKLIRGQVTVAKKTEEEEKPSAVKKLRGQVTVMEEEEEKPSVMKLCREQMTATTAAEEEKPSERQPAVEEDVKEEEKDDGLFMSPGVRTYISSAAGL